MSHSSSRQNDVIALLQRHGAEVADHFKKILAQYDQAPRQLLEAIEYSLLAGGKRLRPALALESFTACAGTDRASALATACALELIHTFSLVHDDLPAMDNDDLRRGKPTCHKVYGEAMAILAGDAMVTMAFQVIAREADPAVAGKIVAELADAAGPIGMVGGQVLDIASENQNLSLQQLQQVHRMKTGALLTASCRLGAIAAKASIKKLQALTDFGRHLGLAFQIVDDILDVTSTPGQLGKATHKDATRGKNTYPALLGLQPSQDEASKHLKAAMDSLADFDSAADGLRMLANFVVNRQT